MQRLKRVMNLVAELWVQKRCLLSDHEPITEYGAGEVFQRCTRCGRRSDGWQRPAARPVLKFDGDPARHVLQPWDLPAVPADFDPSPLADLPVYRGPVAGFIELPPPQEMRLLMSKTNGRVH